MSEERDEIIREEEMTADEELVATEPGKYDRLMAEQSVRRLTGLYKNWFLD